MQFALSMSDVSILIAVVALILLVTSELIRVNSESFGNFAIDKSRLRYAAFGAGILFMGTVLLRMVNPSLF